MLDLFTLLFIQPLHNHQAYMMSGHCADMTWKTPLHPEIKATIAPFGPSLRIWDSSRSLSARKRNYKEKCR